MGGGRRGWGGDDVTFDAKYLKYNTVRYIIVRYIIVQYSTVLYSTLQYNIVQAGADLYGPAPLYTYTLYTIHYTLYTIHLYTYTLIHYTLIYTYTYISV